MLPSYFILNVGSLPSWYFLSDGKVPSRYFLCDGTVPSPNHYLKNYVWSFFGITKCTIFVMLDQLITRFSCKPCSNVLQLDNYIFLYYRFEKVYMIIEFHHSFEICPFSFFHTKSLCYKGVCFVCNCRKVPFPCIESLVHCGAPKSIKFVSILSIFLIVCEILYLTYFEHWEI